MDAFVSFRNRGRALATFFAIVLAGSLLGLCGCESEGARSAQLVTVSPALSEGFEVVDAGMIEHQDDAKLVGISTSRSLEEGDTSRWLYRYVSREQVREYSCRLDKGEFAYTTVRQSMSYLRDEMASIPSPSEIAVDADEAYALVAGQLDDAHLVSSVNIYLRTFISVTENAGDSGVETMTWYFAFNQQGEDGEDEEHSESAGAPQFVYAVDAVTGEVSLVADGVEAAE